jgi:hypothetical protein
MMTQDNSLRHAKDRFGSPMTLRILMAAFVWLLVPMVILPRTTTSQALGWLAILDGFALIVLSFARTWRIGPRNPLEWLRPKWTRFTIWILLGPPSGEGFQETVVWRALLVGVVALLVSMTSQFVLLGWWTL